MWIYQVPRAAPTGRIRRMAATGRPAFAICIGLLAMSVYADESALTLGQAEGIAVKRSQQLAAEDLGITAARERASVSGTLPDPMLKFGVDNLPVEGAARFSTQRDFMTMRRIGLSQEWVRPSTRHLRDARGSESVKVSEAERTVTLAAVQRETAVAWLEAHYAAETVAELQAQKEQAEREAVAAEAGYREGRGTLADVFAIRGIAAEIDERLIDASRRLRVARSTLARWVGEPANSPLAGRPSIDEIPWHRHELVAQLEDHPEIRLASQRAELARTELRLAEAAKKPDWSIELSYAARGEGFSNMVSVGFSVPLQINRGARQNREVAARRAEHAQAEADRADMRRAHTAETEALLEQWETDRARRDRYLGDILPLAAHRSDAALAAYRGGRGMLTDVLAARRSEIEMRIKALEVEASAARAWAALNYLVPDANVARSPPTAPPEDQP